MYLGLAYFGFEVWAPSSFWDSGARFRLVTRSSSLERLGAGGPFCFSTLVVNGPFDFSLETWRRPAWFEPLQASALMSNKKRDGKTLTPRAAAIVWRDHE